MPIFLDGELGLMLWVGNATLKKCRRWPTVYGKRKQTLRISDGDLRAVSVGKPHDAELTGVSFIDRL